MSATVYAGTRGRSARLVTELRIEGGLGPAAGVERVRGSALQLRLEAVQLQLSQLLRLGQPSGLEERRGRRERGDHFVHVETEGGYLPLHLIS